MPASDPAPPSRRAAGEPRRRLPGPCWAAAALALCAFLALPVRAASGDDAQQAATQLNKLRNEIARLNAAEQDEIDRKHRVLAELSGTERRIGDLSKQVAELERRKNALSGRKQTLAQQTAETRNAADAARRELGETLQAAFVLGREPEIKLALEGDDPSAVARLLTYYGYYARASAAHVATLTAQIVKYEKLQLDLAATAHELDRTVAVRSASLADLKKARARRETLVAKLNRDIADKHARAAALQRDAARLEGVIRSVNEDLADVPSQALQQADFGKLEGRLPWPVAGRMTDGFGSGRDAGGIASRAVRIAAPEGTVVHAIAYGRVAYAGWLPYYGLVIILDHGGGYLSVYGHNEALYKQVGDWVQAGDTIATVGTSGGQQKPVLYFQIRHNDHALDPARWCLRGGPAAN